MQLLTQSAVAELIFHTNSFLFLSFAFEICLPSIFCFSDVFKLFKAPKDLIFALGFI